MLVPAGAPVMGRLGPDDMRHGAAARRFLDAEVAIDEERSQPAILEAGILRVGCGKFPFSAHLCDLPMCFIAVPSPGANLAEATGVTKGRGRHAPGAERNLYIFPLRWRLVPGFSPIRR